MSLMTRNSGFPQARHPMCASASQGVECSAQGDGMQHFLHCKTMRRVASITGGEAQRKTGNG